MTRQALDTLEGWGKESSVVLLGVQRGHLDTASAKSASSITSSRGANSGIHLSLELGGGDLNRMRSRIGRPYAGITAVE